MNKNEVFFSIQKIMYKHLKIRRYLHHKTFLMVVFLTINLNLTKYQVNLF